ncbi:MAG: 30S ribosomal protein S16 [Candidatus Omnitrophica bacterium]|jgi:small subunit ribosomal protein S16|nr:30S ribosomal protein S16 [Candidatus Omnitrophota bacterium]
MAVVLRLKRMGTNKKPFWRIVAADKRSPRDGRFIEELGYYDPKKNPSDIKIKKERALYWLKNGAKPSETVRSLLKKVKIEK